MSIQDFSVGTMVTHIRTGTLYVVLQLEPWGFVLKQMYPNWEAPPATFESSGTLSCDRDEANRTEMP